MKNWKVALLALAGFAVVVTGCAKKSTEQASISGTGFESVSSTEELAQLPSSSTASQQAAVEVLPIETSPITQGVPPIAGPTQAALPQAAADIAGLTRDQQIQTALKSAGLYQGDIDGKLGPASKRAIQEFQTAHSLKVDGKVGPQTWAALEPYLTGAGQTVTTTTAE
jgi:peptidoglycan hydrolase-like protein with peptidoglycan-binding domain